MVGFVGASNVFSGCVEISLERLNWILQHQITEKGLEPSGQGEG